MKKNLRNRGILRNLMRITVLQIVFISLGMAMANASDVYSQQLLNRKVTVHANQQQIAEVLETLQKEADVKFIYSYEIIDAARTVDIDVKDKKLKAVLDELLVSNGIAYEVSAEKMIILRKDNADERNDYANEQEATAILVTGQVTSAEDGTGIPGANVILKGTNQGTVTDIEGKFSLEVPSQESVLVISYVGYTAEEIVVGTNSVINVSLMSDLKTLSEIVVIGYGTKTKETLTGSISSIEGEELMQTPSINVAANLQGKLAGLTSNQRSGEPGRDDPNILIRGQGTLNNNNVLIIIDGVPRDNMSRLNPEDIESVSVLKDASAAIYGARAANGVIIVTTKVGKTGKPVFNFSYNSAWSKPTHVPDMLNSVEYAETYNEGEWYAQGRPDAANFSPYYSDAEIQKYRDGSDLNSYPNTNWVDETMKNNALQQRLSLSATGGTEAVRYMLSFAYSNQDGHWKNNPTRYQQFNMRAKIDVDLTKDLTLGVNISGIFNKKEYSSEGTFTNFYNITRSVPTMVAVYPNGLIAGGRFGQNPLLLDRRGHNLIDETPIYTTFTASWKIPGVDGLKLDGSFNYDINNQTNKTWRTPYTYHNYNEITGEYDVESVGLTSPELTDRYDKWTTLLWNTRLNYDKSFGDHNVGAMVGMEQQKNTSSWVSAFRKNYISSAIDEINVGSDAAEDRDNGGTSGAGAYNNFFGRVNYDFKSKYLVEFLFRYDGSQIFPEGSRYGFFPGVSAGWRLSEENFMSSVTSVDNLKVRFSHGQIGNDRVPQWQYLQSYSFGDNYVFGTSDVPGVYPNTLPNPNITWEVSKKTDIGVEGSFWNHLLEVDFTVWKENRSNILTNRILSVPEILGFPGLPDENIGEVDGKGFELVLGHRNTIGEINYTINGNVGYAESKIVYMDEAPNTEAYQDQTGKPIGAELFYVADGIFNTQEELDAYPHNGNSGVGDIKITDQNGDGIINGNDRVRWDKTVVPKWVFGLTLAGSYKNFDLNVFFQGQAGAVNWGRRFADLAVRDEFANAFVERAEDRWTVENPNGAMPRADHNDIGQSTFFLYDASFIRLKSMELGYTLPNSLVSKINLEGVRFYVSGFNLLTWSKEIKYTDPELSGQEIYYPPLKVFNLGISVKF